MYPYIILAIDVSNADFQGGLTAVATENYCSDELNPPRDGWLVEMGGIVSWRPYLDDKTVVRPEYAGTVKFMENWLKQV